MHKHLSIILIVLLSCFFKTAKAQEFNGGLYTGLVASQLDGDRFAGYNKAGLIAGGYINRFINKKTALQFGIRYVQKGSRNTDSEKGVYYLSQLHYIEMPLTLRYFHYKKIDFEAGLGLGYLIAGKENKGGAGLFDATPPFNKFEASGIAGLNYHFNKKVFISGMFCYSISQVRRYSSGYAVFLDKGQHNNIILFTLNYKLSSWK